MSDHHDNHHHHAPASAPTANKTVENVMRIFSILDGPVTFFRGNLFLLSFAFYFFLIFKFNSEKRKHCSKASKKLSILSSSIQSSAHRRWMLLRWSHMHIRSEWTVSQRQVSGRLYVGGNAVIFKSILFDTEKSTSSSHRYWITAPANAINVRDLTMALRSAAS